MRGRLIEEDLFTKFNIIDPKLPEGQKIHEFLMARAQVLAGKHIDFDKTPVTFVLSDSDEPNAFYAPVHDSKNVPKRDEYKVAHYIKNPLETPVVCISRGLLKMIDNLDQLDFVLAHELTHMIMRGLGIRQNSKGEETVGDVHALDLVYDAGSDPKEAVPFIDKINAYAKKQREKEKKNWDASRDKEESGVCWSDIFDVHMTDGNRKAGLEAALTKLSHLIDDKKPTPIDKRVFDPRYSDPVENFLKANNYNDKKSVGKFKILVDCIDQISGSLPAEEFFTAELNALPKQSPNDFDFDTGEKRSRLQKYTKEGCPNYFPGAVIDKKYQQKIASLAEDIPVQVAKGRRQKGNQRKPAFINARDLRLYLYDKAYSHIDKNGHPTAGDLNYQAAAGILYSYFYVLFSGYSHGRKNEEEKYKPRKPPRIEIDIEATKEKIKSAKTAEDFTQAVEKLNRLNGIWREIRTVHYGYNGNGEKLDNLSSIHSHGHSWHEERKQIYDKPWINDVLPWNNLAEIAKTDQKTKDRVIQFLEQYNIEDFRITHNLPYIRTGRSHCYKITDTGSISPDPILEYELDYIIHHDLVLQAYDYIKSYFESEESIIEKCCAEAINIGDKDFREIEITDRDEKLSLAEKKKYALVSLFNAIPEGKKKREYFDTHQTALLLIPDRHRLNHPVPGSKKIGSLYGEKLEFKFDESLFDFKNPIFQTHFGADFEKKLTKRKKAQQQKFFDTAFVMLQRAADLWLQAAPPPEDLEKRYYSLRDKRWSPDPEYTESENQEMESLKKELDFHRKKKDNTTTLIFNFLYSILDKEQSWYKLNRLTPEQKEIFAEFAVKDEKGAILRILETSRYELFCDYLKIRENQTDCAIAGNYEFSPLMEIIASKHGYKHAAGKEQLKAFVDQDLNDREHRHQGQYVWYMHFFDVMRHLEQNPSINIRNFAVALANIEEGEKSYGGEAEKVALARCQNYRKFIKKSNLVTLASRAIGFQENYEGLSCDELVETVDRLVSMRNQLARVFIGGSEYDYSGKKHKPETTPEQKKLLYQVDNTIRNLLKKAEGQALQKDNALEKITGLFKIYNHEDQYSGDKKRSIYLEEINKNGKRLKSISQLSEKETFWPTGALDHVKAFVFAKDTFLDDKDLEDKILNNILSKVENLSARKEKRECLRILLDRNLRAAFPETRDRLFALYAQDAFRSLGKDDGSKKHQRKLAVYLKELGNTSAKDWDIGEKHGKRDGLLSNAISTADKYLLLRQLSDTTVSQEKTSYMMKQACAIKLNSDDMVQSYLYGIGIDYLTEEMDRNPESAHKFIQFLNSRGERKECADISTHLAEKIKKKYEEYKWKDLPKDVLHSIRPSNCKIFYENFWSAPLEARAVAIARMLKCATNKAQNNEFCATQSCERMFDLVMETLIHPDDKSVEAKYARNIMHSYIKSRSDYERVLIMSAMMVANRNMGSDAGNIGKALKLFLENMGPAEIKLGQAISSHPDTPKKIKTELQKLKSAANIPARWTLYDWIKAENIPEEFWKKEHLGEIIASASYYTTAALKDGVLRILRPEAREKAAKGFRVICSTMDDLKQKEGSSDLSYKELTTSVQEMIIQAARMADIETDHEIGQKQYEDAQVIYNDMKITSGGEIFTFKVMDWTARGENWIIMNRALGKTFNALPQNTPEEIAYKKHFAKGYVLFEIRNILSGKKFDHDKHGEQLSVDPKTGAVGIYDTGAMALNDPDPSEQKALGNIIYEVLKGALKGNETFSLFSSIIGEKIEALHASGQDTQYLVEVKKGLLALGDFFSVMSPEDAKDIWSNLDLSHSASKAVYQGMMERMSLLEKTQWRAFVALQTAQEKREIVIDKKETQPRSAVRVFNTAAAPDARTKSGWLQKIFAKSDNDNTPSQTSSFVPVTETLCCRVA